MPTAGGEFSYRTWWLSTAGDERLSLQPSLRQPPEHSGSILVSLMQAGSGVTGRHSGL